MAFDVQNGKKVMLILYEPIISGDNLMQVKEYSHNGLKCNYFCSTCKIDSMNAEKKIYDKYGEIFPNFLHWIS